MSDALKSEIKVQYKNFGPDPIRHLPDVNHQFLMGMPGDLDPWDKRERWDTDTACQLLVLACKIDISKRRNIIHGVMVGPDYEVVVASGRAMPR